MRNNQGKCDTKTRGSMERNNTNKGIELILRKTEFLFGWLPKKVEHCINLWKRDQTEQVII